MQKGLSGHLTEFAKGKGKIPSFATKNLRVFKSLAQGYLDKVGSLNCADRNRRYSLPNLPRPDGGINLPALESEKVGAGTRDKQPAAVRVERFQGEAEGTC
jgi:hypothetical protein